MLDAAVLRDVGGFEALLALFDVVSERLDGDGREHQDHGDVYEDHESLAEVGAVPGERGAGGGPDEHDDGRDGLEDVADGVARTPVHDEAEAPFGIVVVADERGVAEEAHRERDEDGPVAAQYGRQGMLDVEDSGDFLGRLDVAGKTHQRRSRADEERVDEDGERLHEPLLYRVRDARTGACVRGGTHTRFVGVETALDTVHDAASGEAAESGVEREGALEDGSEHGGHVRDVVDDDAECHDHVDGAHDGDEVARDGGDFLGATPDAGGEEDREDDADDDGRGTLTVEAVAREGILNVVGSEQVVAYDVGVEHEGREEDAEPAHAEGRLDVVGGTAVGMPGHIVMALVNLRERRFHESGCRPDDRDEPHPENGAGTAETDGGRDADDVAGAHAGGCRDHQGAERRNPVSVQGLVAGDAEHLDKMPDLRESQTDGKENSCDNQEQRNDVEIVQDGIEGRNARVNQVKHNVLRL